MNMRSLIQKVRKISETTNSPETAELLEQTATTIERLADVINDLTLALELWVEGYPFDEDHKEKHRKLNEYACRLIDKPVTIEELTQMVLGSEKNNWRC